MAHLTPEQRYTIDKMKQQGHKAQRIAEAICKDKSVVSRELARNSDARSGAYRWELAQRKSRDRLSSKPVPAKFTQGVQDYVKALLGKKYSPEQIVGKAAKDGAPCVSHERIYQFIWADKRKGGCLSKHLRTGGKRYRKRGAGKDKRGIITGRVDISNRPAVVEKKERLGDLEIDTIIGKDHKGAILTINDRASGMVKIRKLAGKDAQELAAAAVEALQDWKPYLHTITADNGKEFAAHKAISDALGVAFYFARPYHSWERGANENLNGLIRQYIPKKTDFSTISDEYVAFVEKELNQRPRKRFNFESPEDIFNKKKVAFTT